MINIKQNDHGPQARIICQKCNETSRALLWLNGRRLPLAKILHKPGSYKGVELDLQCPACESIFVGPFQEDLASVKWFCTWDTTKVLDSL